MTTGQVPDRVVETRLIGRRDLTGDRWWDDDALTVVARPSSRRRSRNRYAPVGNPPENIDVCPECGAYVLRELGCLDPGHGAIGAIGRRSRSS